MIKKVIQILLFLILVFLIYFGNNGLIKEQEKNKIKTVIQSIPNLVFYDLNGDTISFNRNNPKAKVIVYFHPNCEHCQYETKELIKNEEKFTNTEILMISPAPIGELKEFIQFYKINQSNTIRILWDKDQEFEEKFGPCIYPTVFIYKYNQLQKKYVGEVKIETILKNLIEDN